MTDKNMHTALIALGFTVSLGVIAVIVLVEMVDDYMGGGDYCGW